MNVVQKFVNIEFHIVFPDTVDAIKDIIKVIGQKYKVQEFEYLQMDVLDVKSVTIKCEVN